MWYSSYLFTVVTSEHRESLTCQEYQQECLQPLRMLRRKNKSLFTTGGVLQTLFLNATSGTSIHTWWSDLEHRASLHLSA